jgi:hypothetical protein
MPRGRAVIVGSEIHFYCNVTGEPAPQITWYKEGVPIEVSDHIELPGMGITLNFYNLRHK